MFDYSSLINENQKQIEEFIEPVNVEELSIQNYPNPFNPITNFEIKISKAGRVNLKVYDILGREAAVLMNEDKQEGIYNISFNGSQLTSGVYFYRLETSSGFLTKKMLLIK